MCYNIGMLDYTDICFNIEKYQEMCREKGVTFTLATKTIPKETLERLSERYDLIYGENRVQELVDKYFEGPRWIFIGRLQKNKVKYLVNRVEMICSVDSVNLAKEIQKRCVAKGKVMPVLIEINLGEEQKGGVSIEELPALIQEIQASPNLDWQGLMAVLPIEGAPDAAAKAADVYQTLKKQYPIRYLSMGMSQDFELAIEAGGNMVRLGSAVFGRRS